MEHLDLGNCTPLTFIGKGIQEHLGDGQFCGLKALNLRGCKSILDEGVAVIAKAMPKLKHLNLSRCFRITDASASVIGQRCSQLLTLSVEGALGITDVGLGMICSHTLLDSINITGCSVSRKSLMAVVLALEYVKESSSFFGFVLRDSSAKVAVLNAQEMGSVKDQQNKAAHIIRVGRVTIALIVCPLPFASSLTFLYLCRVAGT